MPIDPNEAPKGYYAVDTTETEDSCMGCAFDFGGLSMNMMRCTRLGRRCWASDRNDRASVIFKKIDHGFRIDNLGAACG